MSTQLTSTTERSDREATHVVDEEAPDLSATRKNLSDSTRLCGSFTTTIAVVYVSGQLVIIQVLHIGASGGHPNGVFGDQRDDPLSYAGWYWGVRRVLRIAP